MLQELGGFRLVELERKLTRPLVTLFILIGEITLISSFIQSFIYFLIV